MAACLFDLNISTIVNPYSIVRYDCQNVIANKIVNYGSSQLMISAC